VLGGGFEGKFLQSPPLDSRVGGRALVRQRAAQKVAEPPKTGQSGCHGHRRASGSTRQGSNGGPGWAFNIHLQPGARCTRYEPSTMTVHGALATLYGDAWAHGLPTGQSQGQSAANSSSAVAPGTGRGMALFYGSCSCLLPWSS
jgi:hypothetical protein